MEPLKVRRIDVNGRLRPGVYAKDVILDDHPPARREGRRRLRLRVRAATPSMRMSMDERMTICNMSIEGGARVGYVNPDETTFEYLRGPAVRAAGRRRSTARWRGGERWRPTPDARYDDDVRDRRRRRIEPTVTWGINPGQSVGVDERMPIADATPSDRPAVSEALGFMGFERGPADRGHARSTSRSSARAPTAGCRTCAKPPRVVRGRHVAPHVQGAGRAGLAGGRARPPKPRACDEIFRDAGFEWRGAGCSMCLA